MKIEKIDWISHVAKETEVYLSDGKYVCVAFCQPCEYEEGVIVLGPLHAFMAEKVMLSYNKEVFLNRAASNLFAYKGTAVVLDLRSALISVGGFQIELDENIPPGIANGDLIDFECARLDLW